MRYGEWEPFYREITDDMGYDPERDADAARLLASLVRTGVDEGRIRDPRDTLLNLAELIFDKIVYVFGAGPNLPDELARVVELELFGDPKWTEYVPEADFTLKLPQPEWKRRMVAVSADTATETLMVAGIFPKIIVTDLDGGVERQLEAARDGAILVVHAHGDNVEQIERYVPEMSGMILPTCQCAPFGIVFNFGGFTDGDRAVFMAQELKAVSATLVGFDFTSVGTIKEMTADRKRIKLRKLVWASLLIELIRQKMKVVRFSQIPIY